MVKNVPTAGAALNIPKPSGPTFKISWATTGSNATQKPNRTAIISKVSAPKTAFVLKTNLTPSLRLCITGSPIFGFKIGFFLILRRMKNDIKTSPKMIHRDQCTPIQLIQKPANAGPNTDAICQVELFQVAAFGYIFLGTIKATNEKMVGPKNERKKPPKNTKAYIAYKMVLFSIVIV